MPLSKRLYELEVSMTVQTVQKDYIRDFINIIIIIGLKDPVLADSIVIINIKAKLYFTPKHKRETVAHTQ